MPTVVRRKPRRNRKPKAADPGCPNEVTYAVLELGSGGRVLKSGMTREGADGYAWGYNGAALSAGSSQRAAVLADSDVPADAPRELPPWLVFIIDPGTRAPTLLRRVHSERAAKNSVREWNRLDREARKADRLNCRAVIRHIREAVQP